MKKKDIFLYSNDISILTGHNTYFNKESVISRMLNDESINNLKDKDKDNSEELQKYTSITGYSYELIKDPIKMKLLETDTFRFYIIGTIDAKVCHTNRYIKVKTRMSHLFKELRDYEKVELYTYMKIMNCKSIDLIESNLDGDIYIITVDYEDIFYNNEIESRLFNVINGFIESYS
jgi:hypothetical protein